MLELEQILVLSTAHISEDSRLWCDEQVGQEQVSPWSVYQKGEYGWFFPIYTFESEGEWEEKKKQIPLDVFQCLRFADKKGVQWLMLDRDGPFTDQLPTFEW